MNSPREWQFITDRLDLTPRQVVELYQYRWQIERSFAWIKRHLQYGQWYSQCENGVLIQLYAGLICFVLLKLYVALGVKPKFRALRIDLVRWVARHLFDPMGQAEVLSYQQALFSSTPNTT